MSVEVPTSTSVHYHRHPAAAVVRPIFAVLGGAMVGLTALALVASIWESGPANTCVGGLAIFVLVGAASAWCSIQRWSREMPLPGITIDRLQLHLPRSNRSPDLELVPLQLVREVELVGDRLIIVASEDRRYSLERREFIDPQALEKLGRAVRQAISIVAPERLAAFDLVREESQRLRRINTPVVTSLAVLVLVAAGLQLLIGALWRVDSVDGARVGALSRVLVSEGQWFRLVSAAFLHSGWSHLVVNLGALWSVGPFVERVLGKASTFLVAIAALFGASLASLLLGHAAMSLGASGIVYGLLGAAAVVQLRFGERLPPSMRLSRRGWIWTFAINAALALVNRHVDHFAHLGGLIAGAALAWGLSARLSEPGPKASASASVSGLAALSLALVGLGLVGAVRHAMSDVDFEREAERATLENPRVRIPQLNELAWVVAIDPNSPRERLESARRGMARASSASPDSALRDTAATLEHRLGNHEQAAWLELDAIAQEPKAFYFTQVARFLAAQPKPVQILWRGATPDTVQLRSAEGGLVLALDGSFAAGVRVRARPARGEDLTLVELSVGRDRIVSPAVCQLEGDRPPVPEYELLLVDASGAGLSPRVLECRWHPPNAEATALPGPVPSQPMDALGVVD